MSDGAVTTPEFLRWSLDYACSLRDMCPSGEPEQVERQLKTLRAVAECEADGRVLEGVCFPSELDRPHAAPPIPLGFRQDEALAAYGGDDRVSFPCLQCAAHVDRGRGPVRWAGCYGLVDWRPVQAELPEVVDRLLGESKSATRRAELFLATTPSWRGLWVASPLDSVRLDVLRPLIARLAARGDAWREAFGRLAAALEVASTENLSLHVAYGAAGRIVGRSWTVEAHCPRCRAPRTTNLRPCDCCGSDARPSPPRKRLGRGRRPFRPLAEFLAAAAQRDLLRRYLGTREWTPAEIDEYLEAALSPTEPPKRL